MNADGPLAQLETTTEFAMAIKMAIVGVVVAFLILMALRGGRGMAKVIMGAAGVVFLAGVSYVLVFNLARFANPSWSHDIGPFVAEREYWGGPHDAPAYQWPHHEHMPLPAPQPPMQRPMTSVAEVVSAVPAELAAAPAAPALAAPASVILVATGPQPGWVNRPAVLQDGVYRLPVVVGPYENNDPEAERALTREISKAFQQYVEMDRGSDVAAHASFAPGEIRRQFVKETWSEPYQSETPAMGPMVRLHALLAFDDLARNAIERRHAETIGGRRLIQAGGFAAALLLAISALFGYLKLDTMTRGYYSGRLKVAAGTALVVAGILALSLS